MSSATVVERTRAPGAVRVLVVEDSASQRAMLVHMFNSDPGLRVVGCAASGAEGVKAAARLRPDVITMDLLMPTMDGLEASRLIMQRTPTPIVMVTGTAAPKDQAMAAEAFRAGVLALAEKPGLDHGAASPVDLVETIKGMAKLKVIRRLAPDRFAKPVGRPSYILAPSSAERDSSLDRIDAARAAPAQAEIVVIGSSTGGPQALQQLFSRLPADFPLPILVVQHIAKGFTGALVDWIRTQCRVTVELAYHGQRLDRAGVLFAPSDRHMVVRDRAIFLVEGPTVSGHRPSATALFQSVAVEYGAAALGVVLTGMADDGAVGLQALKECGATTIVQDESTCVVFGMPAAAISLGVVDHVLPPAEIADQLIALARNDHDE